MRLLIDEDVDVRVIAVLKKLGHNVRRVPLGTTNGSVIRLAQQERRVLITRDSDFTNAGLYPPFRYLGIVHIAIHPPSFEKIMPPLKHILESLSAAEFPGKLFALEETGYHEYP